MYIYIYISEHCSSFGTKRFRNFWSLVFVNFLSVFQYIIDHFLNPPPHIYGEVIKGNKWCRPFPSALTENILVDQKMLLLKVYGNEKIC